MWSRPTGITIPVQVTSRVLPTKGSNHHGFLEMLFLWGANHPDDARYRSVVLPHGFNLQQTDTTKWAIIDSHNFTRAVATIPAAQSEAPSIVPLKRFSHNSHAVDRFYVGTVNDWDSVVYRTKRLSTQADALAAAKKWLDERKPKWDSYISEINFERRP